MYFVESYKTLVIPSEITMDIAVIRFHKSKDMRSSYNMLLECNIESIVIVDTVSYSRKTISFEEFLNLYRQGELLGVVEPDDKSSFPQLEIYLMTLADLYISNNIDYLGRCDNYDDEEHITLGGLYTISSDGAFVTHTYNNSFYTILITSYILSCFKMNDSSQYITINNDKLYIYNGNSVYRYKIHNVDEFVLNLSKFVLMEK